MLIAEELLLLLTNDETGRLVVPAEQADIALGGAMLVELALGGRVDIDGRKRVQVLDPSPTGDAFLDGALRLVSTRRGSKPQRLVVALGKRLRPALYARLADQGILRSERRKLFRLIPFTTWVTQNGRREVELRQALDQTLVVGVEPQPRTAALVGLLHALRCVHKVVLPSRTGLRRRELDRRAKQVAEGDWASQAVRRAIDAATAAASSAGSAG